jgi:rhamnosyl/mannosyltransferase
MRVLHFFKTALPDTMGGVEQVIHQVAHASRKYGVESHVLALSPDPEPEIMDMGAYKVHRVQENFNIASTGFSLKAFSKFKELAAESDIVNFHFPWPFMDLIHFASRHNKPSVVSYHSDIVNQKNLLKLYRPLQNKFLQSADHIIASSPNYLASSEVLTQFKDKTSIIPIGVDRGTYPVAPPALLGKWEKAIGGPFFLFIGVLRYYKGLHTLLDALEHTGYPLVIVGSGPKEQELKAQAQRLRLRNVHFLGRVSDNDKVALLQLSTAVVFPSHLRSEAFGITLIEGAMHGKPLISCEIGTGTTYINIANETGLVVPPEEPIALREALRYLWENPDAASAMGAKSLARFNELFTGEKMVEAYMTVYRNLFQA